MHRRRPTVSAVCKVLGGPRRLEVLLALAGVQRETSVTNLAQQLQLDDPTASRALRALRSAGIVTYRAYKKQHFYRLDKSVSIRRRRGVVRIRILCKNGRIFVETRRIPV